MCSTLDTESAFFVARYDSLKFCVCFHLRIFSILFDDVLHFRIFLSKCFGFCIKKMTNDSR